MTVGIVHPGAMGAAVARTFVRSGRDVVWASAGRSAATAARADEQGLRDVVDLSELCRISAIVVSICPPHAAERVALDIAATGYDGIYVDANAIAPERARRIAATVEGAGAAFVDGGVIGGPTSERDSTWLHLSGPRAAEVAGALGGGPLEANVVSDRVGDASALKMSFAAYTKGATALLAASLATAEQHGVRKALEAQWERSAPGFLPRESERLRRAAAKAWRFEGEMHEIDETLRGAGVPAGFHEAAALLYARLARYKDDPPPDLPELLRAIREG